MSGSDQVKQAIVCFLRVRHLQQLPEVLAQCKAISGLAVETEVWGSPRGGERIRLALNCSQHSVVAGTGLPCLGVLEDHLALRTGMNSGLQYNC